MRAIMRQVENIVMRRLLLSASYILCSSCVLSLSFLYIHLHTQTLCGSSPKALSEINQYKCVWMDVSVHLYTYVWDKPCVCMSMFVFTVNSDLISHSKRPSVGQEIVLEFRVYYRRHQRQSPEKNQTNLYIYERRIHFTAYITPALSTLIPKCYINNMSS